MFKNCLKEKPKINVRVWSNCCSSRKIKFVVQNTQQAEFIFEQLEKISRELYKEPESPTNDKDNNR